MKQSADWVLACIQSCTNQFQLEACKVLVSLFKMKFESEPGFALHYGELLNAVSDRNTFLSVDA